MKLTSSEIADMRHALDKMDAILLEAADREAPAITAEDVRSIGVGTSLVTGEQQLAVLGEAMTVVEAYNRGVYAMGEQIIREYALEPEQDLEWQAANPSEAPGPVVADIPCTCEGPNESCSSCPRG
ncbi:hypothetical protein E3_0730 [Rhodococcus phage E3]|uniref:hypothetical protein n=1 Tax=Rhodococcus phage E3 TaxID=1007869 RepID=UPI0002C6DC77|nr:hypothetical protein M176_gp077 [Rhodococcus phage E3]AEQ20986.1 hypothetical protein E3_0730 [Rhodococcus phage E3]